MFRRATALFFHAPGLWLLFREPIPASLRFPNLIAIMLTVIAMGLSITLAPQGSRVVATVSAWLIGHLLWGTILAVRLPPRPSPRNGPGTAQS